MKILIGADLVPTKSNEMHFCNGDGVALVGQELYNLLNEADYRIFNLEVPLTDTLTPIAKCGPALIAATKAVSGYKALGVDLLTLANNHIMDQGEQGLVSTIQTLKENEIAYVGAGENLQTAQKSFVLERDGHRIGVYACAEHEFSIADTNVPGANPFDPLESLDHIAELKKQTDYVIVLYHGGKEHYRYPSPMLQKICRKMIEKGADLVICQHSHCVGCEEKYLNGTIVYGQGNFIFDDSNNEFWQTSLLVELTIEDDVTLTYHPLKKQGNTVRLAQGDEAESIIQDFYHRSEQIKDPNIILERYGAFAEDMSNRYLTAMLGVNTKNIFFRVFNRLTGRKLWNWYLKTHFSKNKRLALRNYIECEAHREVILFFLKER